MCAPCGEPRYSGDAPVSERDRASVWRVGRGRTRRHSLRAVNPEDSEVEPMRSETAFTMDSSSIKYGPGVTREVGHDMSQWGARRVLVVTDPYLAPTEPV